MKAIRGIIAAAAVVLGACAPGADPANSPFERNQPREVTVQVQNQNWSDMVVYAVRGGMRVRLGTVSAMSRGSFPVPRTALAGSGQLRLLADPIGSSRGFLSDVLSVRPGQRVSLEVGHDLAMSFTSVWN